jgi:hypothetical protein
MNRMTCTQIELTVRKSVQETKLFSPAARCVPNSSPNLHPVFPVSITFSPHTLDQIHTRMTEIPYYDASKDRSRRYITIAMRNEMWMHM